MPSTLLSRSDTARSTAFGGKKLKFNLLKSLTLKVSALGIIVPLATIGAAPAYAQSTLNAATKPSEKVTLSIGNGQLVHVAGTMADVFVADERIADVQVKSTNQLYLFAKAPGTTTVYASNAAGAIVWSASVQVGANFDSVDSMLRLAMPDAQIGVATMGSNTFLLTGQVQNPEDAAEAERLVKAYAGEEANVISRLTIATPLQVNLQVRIAEVSRSLIKSIGVNITSADATGGTQFVIGQGRGQFPQYAPRRPLGIGSEITPGASTIVPNANGTTLGLAGKLLGLDLLGALDAGETIGLVTTLAQPNLTALSGETAEFLAGGEFPIPISQTLGMTTIQYKRYGVSLSYTPTVLSSGRISMRVRPEVSELTTEGSVTLNGYSVPGLTTRRTETTVELGSGQSFMIAGLLSNHTQNSIQKLPGVGDIPILGSLFRSTSYRRGETELVIIVTPYLVKPADNASQVALPTDGFNSPNEVQRILGNVENDGVDGAKRPEATRGTSKSNSSGAASSAAKPGFSFK